MKKIKEYKSRYPASVVESKVFLQLTESAIAFRPHLAKIVKDANAGLFLSQLVYWWPRRSKEQWIYKTSIEIQEETCLTRREQERSIRLWAEKGVLLVTKMGAPPKRHFQINWQRLILLLEVLNTNPADQIVQNDSSNAQNVHLSTENTTKTNSKMETRMEELEHIEMRCIDLSKQLGFKYSQTLTLKAKLYGLPMIERACGIMREIPNVQNKEAYFNSLIKSFIEKR